MGLRLSIPDPKNDDEDEWCEEADEGLRFTYSWTASRAQVSSDLNEYLLEMRAMSINCVRSAPAELTTCNSGGLVDHQQMLRLDTYSRTYNAYNAHTLSRKD